MRFKVDKKDFFLFILYSILLLYLCAVAVLNFSPLANDGSFYGLMPFLAFTPKYLGATLILFIVVMVIIIANPKTDSCSHSFAERVAQLKSGFSSESRRLRNIKSQTSVKILVIIPHIAR